MSTHAIPLRLRSTLAVALVSVVGLVAFGWPLLAAPDSALAHSADAPYLFGLLVVLLVAVVLAEIADGGLDSKAVAMLGVLTAVAAVLRPIGGGLTGFSPMFVVLVLGGRVLGRGFGFVLGAVSMFASAVLTGGVGPWLPFQMLGAAWVGFGAGCLPRCSDRTEILLLSAYGAVSGLLYGFLLNLWFWPFLAGDTTSLSFRPGEPLHDNLARFLVFCVTTSLGFDLVRAVGNVVLVLVAGAPLLRTLRRASRRAAFDAAPRFDSPVDAPHPAAAAPAGPA